MKFSIGYNEENDFFELVKKYRNNISTIYFPMFHHITGSGRSITERTKTLKEYYDKVIKLIIICKSYGIETDLLLNSVCDGENTGNKDFIDKIIKLVKPLYSYGLTTVTLTDLSIVNRFKYEFPNIIICNSLNAFGVESVEESLILKNIGVDILTIDSNINYNVSLIRKIKEKSKLKIKILINNSCMSMCPFDKQHANLATHFCEPDGRIWEKGACGKIFRYNRRKFFRVPFIRPEDLKNYEFVDYLKISTRDRETHFIDKLLNIYISENYDGNILDILEVAFSDISNNKIKYIDNKKLGKLGFFEDMLKCPKDCDTCTNCDKFF
ncbi:MAG: hypothetical protein PHZ26_02520 [Candidatus Gracilibacteria bacterium]|nr:hypothetical protein [Candidatus Gracilibacteria bacterium]MDD2908607.1 hypothetical protein [Candidatus Gracilibacteria bacterium]